MRRRFRRRSKQSRAARHFLRRGDVQSIDNCPERNLAVQRDGYGNGRLQLRSCLVGERWNDYDERTFHCASFYRQCYGDGDQHRRYNQVRHGNDCRRNAIDSADDFFRIRSVQSIHNCARWNFAVQCDSNGHGKL